jgi:hypothetical protein
MSTNRPRGPRCAGVFQCFEGRNSLTIATPAGTQVLVMHLTALHAQILSLLGPSYRAIYQLPN